MHSTALLEIENTQITRCPRKTEAKTPNGLLNRDLIEGGMTVQEMQEDYTAYSTDWRET